MKKKNFAPFVPFLLIIVSVALVISAAAKVKSVSAAVAEQPKSSVIILDAGHGGVDGGTSGKNGELEKDINLSIVKHLKDMLTSAGFTVILTRDADVSIHDEHAKTIREMKVSDLENRLKIMNQHHGAIFISIHQNHYSESRYSGAQMFYSTNDPASKKLAEHLQASFVSRLQPSNTRQIKPCGNDVYLMKQATTTAVLAECGFLSNPEEARLLGDAAYQKKLAYVIFCGVLDYFSANAE